MRSLENRFFYDRCGFLSQKEVCRELPPICSGLLEMTQSSFSCITFRPATGSFLRMYNNTKYLLTLSRHHMGSISRIGCFSFTRKLISCTKQVS